MMDLNNLLADLQKQCLSDPDDLVEELKGSIDTLKETPSESVIQMQRTLHNIKGNTQTVGFTFLAKFAHDFETVLEKVHVCLMSGVELPRVNLLFTLLTQAADDIGKYFDDLRSGMSDSEVLGDLRSESLAPVLSWCNEQSTSPTQDNPPEQENFENLKSELNDSKILEEHVCEEESQPQLEQISSQPKLQIVLKELLSFSQNGTRYALPLSIVDEILETQVVQKFPFQIPNVLGMVLHRGEPLTIVDTQYYGVPLVEKNPSAIIVVKNENRQFGFLVDAVEGIFLPTHQNLQHADTMCSVAFKWTLALYKENENHFVIIDPSRAFSGLAS